MTYIIKITADVIDPSDPEYIATNKAIFDMSLAYGCKRSMEYDGNVEVGIFEFATLEDVKAFRDNPIHAKAMRNVKKIYKSMKVERNWREND
ncbi:MAG: hypothetical protein K0U45_06100 [Alphaproteobacteria bacterium]|nr:hypothetical protein [Alphaproteobacteria bacterium]